MDEEQRWQANAEDHAKFEAVTLDLHKAIYGDAASGGMGMKKQLEEMYSVFVPVTVTGKVIIKTIIFIGTIAGAVAAIVEAVKLFISIPFKTK